MYSDHYLPKSEEKENYIYVLIYNLNTNRFLQKKYGYYKSVKDRFMFQHELCFKNGIRQERLSNLQFDDKKAEFTIITDDNNVFKDKAHIYKCANKRLVRLNNYLNATLDRKNKFRYKDF